MTGHPVPREVQAAIVGDLARMTRTASQIADRHRVPLELVVKLRETHGPDPVALAAAVKRLQRPEPHRDPLRQFIPKLKPEPVVEVEPESQPHDSAVNNIPAEIPAGVPDAEPAGLVAFDKPKRGAYSDGLSKDERAIVRAWATSTPGAPQPGIQGQIRRDCVEAWEAAGRPTVEPPRVPAPAPARSDCQCAHSIVSHHQDSGSRFGWGRCGHPGCGCTEYRRHVAAPETSAPVEGGEASPAPTPEAVDAEGDTLAGRTIEIDGAVDVVEATILCLCGAEVSDWTSACPDCGHVPMVAVECTCGCLTHTGAAGKTYIEWARAYDEAMQIPELAVECRAVADAVEMLRDAKAEHDRRAPMLEAIKVELNALLACSPEIPRADFERAARRILDVVS